MGTLGTILSWAVFGLVIGVIARFLYPGRQPMSILATMALGIVGSLLGGFFSYLLGNNPADHCRAAIGCICPPLPFDTSTTKPGRFSASEPSP